MPTLILRNFTKLRYKSIAYWCEKRCVETKNWLRRFIAKRDYSATINQPLTLKISLWLNAKELRSEIFSVDAKFHAHSHRVNQISIISFTMAWQWQTDSVTWVWQKSWGGVRNNHAWRKVWLRRIGVTQWHEIWSICPSSSALLDGNLKTA